MPRDFLQLWKHKTADMALSEGGDSQHSGSDQLYRVAPGDTVWIVTVYPHGELVLLGKLQVGECIDWEGAKRLLGTDDVWKAKYHVIAKPNTEEPLRKVDLMGIAYDLRFVSKAGKDRLNVPDGRVDAKQLQTMRELTKESATMLEQRWSGNQQKVT